MGSRAESCCRILTEPREFSIRWNGSVLAPETGEFDFVVRTEHAVRLWVNDQNHPLIDAWVKSGSDTEFRGSLFLLAGRPYPLRLEFTKAKQGVDDSKDKKEKPPSNRLRSCSCGKLPRPRCSRYLRCTCHRSLSRKTMFRRPFFLRTIAATDGNVARRCRKNGCRPRPMRRSKRPGTSSAG